MLTQKKKKLLGLWKIIIKGVKSKTIDSLQY